MYKMCFGFGKRMYKIVLAVVRKEYLVLAESDQKNSVFNSHVHKAIKALFLSLFINRKPLSMVYI